MTARQKIIIWLWIAAIVAAGIYPTWLIADVNQISSWPSNDRALIFTGLTGGRIDAFHLMVEWFLATIVAAGLYFVWPFADRSSKQLG